MITRLKLPFGKLPHQYTEDGIQQWSDYCAVTDVNSDKPNDVVLVDLALTGLSKANAIKINDVSEAVAKDLTDFEITSKRGLPEYIMAEAKV